MERVATFSDRLAQYRTENDLTLAEMESKTGIPNQTLSRYELNQRAPKVDVAIDIAIKLNVNPLWLQGYNVAQDAPINDIHGEHDPEMDELIKSQSKKPIIPHSKGFLSWCFTVF